VLPSLLQSSGPTQSLSQVLSEIFNVNRPLLNITYSITVILSRSPTITNPYDILHAFRPYVNF
jgi:hypothetical protein